MRTQKAPLQAPHPRPHQRSHAPRQSMQHLASHLHRRRRPPDPLFHLPVFPPQPQPRQAGRYWLFTLTAWADGGAADAVVGRAERNQNRRVQRDAGKGCQGCGEAVEAVFEAVRD